MARLIHAAFWHLQKVTHKNGEPYVDDWRNEYAGRDGLAYLFSANSEQIHEMVVRFYPCEGGESKHRLTTSPGHLSRTEDGWRLTTGNSIYEFSEKTTLTAREKIEFLPQVADWRR